MPTGYTAKLCEQDVPFAEFVMTCARAMGACILMRDEPLDAPIPESFEERDYHGEQLKAAQDELALLLAMDDAVAEAFGVMRKGMEILSNENSLARVRAQNKRLSDMLAKVDEWNPPTPDHIGLKKFMKEQLTVSMDNENYHVEYLEKAKANTPRHYYSLAVEGARRNIEYHEKERVEDAERNQGRTDWVKQLRASLT